MYTAPPNPGQTGITAEDVLLYVLEEYSTNLFRLKVSAIAASIAAPSTLLNGVQTVPTPGTPVALAASTSCSSVSVTANATNTDVILVGNSATQLSPLYPGQSKTIDIDNLDKIFIDAVVASEGVDYLGS